MKTIDEIRYDLKCVRWHYPRPNCFNSPSWYWDRDFDELDEIQKSFENAVKAAPKLLREVYDGMYRNGKTQKEIAIERNVSEKYIQILHKRLILFLCDYFANESGQRTEASAPQ